MALLESVMGGGAILIALLIAATQLLKWPKWLNYVWAVIILIWGVLAFT